MCGIEQQLAAFHTTNLAETSMTKLYEACSHGDLSQIKKELQEWRDDPTIEDPDPANDYYIPLAEAISKGHIAVVEYLLDQGAPLSFSLAAKACLNGLAPDVVISLFETFVAHGLDVNVTGSSARGFSLLS